MRSISKSVVLGILFASTWAMAGGVSDGGGGTTNPSPIKPGAIQSTLNSVTPQILRLWINSKTQWTINLFGPPTQNPAIQKLFNSTPNIYDALETAKIELRYKAPCFDPEGQPVDGSTVSTTPGAICISPFTMAPKLTHYNYEYETAALVLHELAHTIGFNEDDAKEVQARMIDDIYNQDLGKSISNAASAADQSYELDEIKTALNYGAPYKQVLEAKTEFETSRAALNMEPPFLAIRNEEVKRLDAEHIRISVLSWQRCVEDLYVSPSDRNTCQDLLDAGFAGKSEASAWDILDKTNPFAPFFLDESFKVVMIKRPTTKTVWKQQAQLILSALKSVSEHAASDLERKFELFSSP